MAAKRKLSTRRRQSAVEAQTPTRLEEQNAPATVKDGLPTRVEDDEPLPVLNAPQAASLSPAEYQSIAERRAMTWTSVYHSWG